MTLHRIKLGIEALDKTAIPELVNKLRETLETLCKVVCKRCEVATPAPGAWFILGCSGRQNEAQTSMTSILVTLTPAATLRQLVTSPQPAIHDLELLIEGNEASIMALFINNIIASIDRRVRIYPITL